MHRCTYCGRYICSRKNLRLELWDGHMDICQVWPKVVKSYGERASVLSVRRTRLRNALRYASQRITVH
jgi:hypothetical protein